MDKLKFHKVPAKTEMLEMMCVPSEYAAYNKKHANLGITKK